MADEELGSASVRITLDDTDVDSDARALARRIEAAIDRGTRNIGRDITRRIGTALRNYEPPTVSVPVVADLDEFERTMRSLRTRKFPEVRITVVADLTRFEAQLRSLTGRQLPEVSIQVTPDMTGFVREVQRALNGREVSIRVVPDLTDFDRRIRAHNAPDVTVNVNVDRNRFLRALNNLGRTSRRVGSVIAKSLAFGVVGLAAASAAGGVAALVGALAPAAGALAALPALAGGAAIALGTLRLATLGVGEALSALASGDAAKFEEALRKLSPAAQEALRSIQKFGPELRKVQQAIQESFFEQFGRDIQAAVKNLLPLGKELEKVAAELGIATSEALKFAASPEAFQGLQSVIQGTRDALSGLGTATQPVLKGLLDVAAAISDAFGVQLGEGIASAGARFGTFLSTAAASGRAVEWVREAGETFRQLGAIASNVGGIISGVFGAANDVGGGLLNNLERITGEFEEFVKSAQGQEAIGGIFTALSAAAQQLTPILKAIVTQLGAIGPAVAQLFTSIGPAITNLINAIGPAIQSLLPGVQDLVDGFAEGLDAISSSGAFDELGTALGSISSAIAPLLPVIGELVGELTAALLPAVTAVAEALTPVVSAFADALAPVIPPIAEAFDKLVQALQPLIAALGETLTQVVEAAAPLLLTLAGAVTQIVDAVTPLIEQLTAALIPILQQLAPIITQIVIAITPLITALVDALLPVLPPLVEAFIAIVQALAPLLPLIGQLVAAIAPLLVQLTTILAPIIQFAAEIIKWLSLNVVVPVIEAIVTVLKGIVTAVSAVITAVSGFVETVIGFFTNLKTNVTTIVSGLITAVVGFFTGLPGKAVAAVSSIVGKLGTVFTNARNAVVKAVTTLVSDTVTLVKGLPGKAVAAIGDLSGKLVAAGKALIQGFIKGIKSVAADVASAAKGVAKGALDAVTGFLGISSPSKVFIQIGKFVAQGFVKGLTGSSSDIQAAADKLAQQIRDAFKGKNTRLDDRLIASLRATEKELLALAKRRESIADRIKKANEFAAQTTQAALQSFSLANAARGGADVKGITDNLEVAVRKIREFNGDINTLARRGLRRDLLQQIIGLGPDQGGALAAQLADATSQQLKDLNDAQKQLSDAAKKLGKDSADVLFDAGKEASKGFLAGLKAQQKEVEDLMLTIARSMAKAIRKALGIKSPSRVFAAIGKQTMAGLDVGLRDSLAAPVRTAQRAAAAISDPFGGQASLRASVGPQNGAQRRETDRPRAGNTITNNFTINAVSDADSTAQRVINRMVLAGGGL